jgi:hypothetical protein
MFEMAVAVLSHILVNVKREGIMKKMILISTLHVRLLQVLVSFGSYFCGVVGADPGGLKPTVITQHFILIFYIWPVAVSLEGSNPSPPLI